MNKVEFETILEQLKLSTDSVFVLAVSGGVDSMVLWDLFERAQKKVVIAHVHHHQRKEADEEYRMIEERCQKQQVSFYGTHLRFSTHHNFQARAREARLRFFKEVAQKVNSKTVVLAHHFDDQIETLVMRMLKGTSWQTWRGMKTYEPFQDLVLYRPLLSVSKASIYSYALSQNISYYEDASNKSLRYERNRVRHKTLPFLRQHNPQIDEQLDCLRGLVNRFNQCFKRDLELIHKDDIDRSILLDYPPLFQQNFFLTWLNKQTKKQMSRAEVNTLLRSIQHQKHPLYFPLSKHHTLCSAYEKIWIERVQTPRNSINILNFGEYRIEAHYGVFVSKEKNSSSSSQMWELCYNEATFPITLRHRKKGDVILMPYGHKKVKSLLIDLKIPQPQRDHLWLIESQGVIHGILGLPIQRDCQACAEKIYLTEVSYAQS